MTLPVASTLGMDGEGLVQDWRIFMDVYPLYVPLAEEEAAHA